MMAFFLKAGALLLNLLLLHLSLRLALFQVAQGLVHSSQNLLALFLSLCARCRHVGLCNVVQKQTP
jgi:hypothetical protein